MFPVVKFYSIFRELKDVACLRNSVKVFAAEVSCDGDNFSDEMSALPSTLYSSVECTLSDNRIMKYSKTFSFEKTVN